MQHVDFILSLFQEPIWPRTVSTKTTEGRQVLVFNKDQALARFRQANFLDCRINAYPDYTDYHGINRQAPNLIMIDFDLEHFRSKEALYKSLKNTITKIKETFVGVKPTVLWTGNGYHIYLPVISPILEQIEYFSKFDRPSRSFLRFAEWYLSSGKCDEVHSATVSFRNRMLRIPGSYNSKYIDGNIKLIQKWNGYRPSVSPLIGSFYAWLVDQKFKELEVQKKYLKSQSPNGQYIQWIEKLLQTPIEDFRKYAIWRIVAPYLMNIRKLSEEQASIIIKDWLYKCNNAKILNFNVNQKIREGLSGSSRGYIPISLDNLRKECNNLYSIVNFSFNA